MGTINITKEHKASPGQLGTNARIQGHFYGLAKIKPITIVVSNNRYSKKV